MLLTKAVAYGRQKGGGARMGDAVKPRREVAGFNKNQVRLPNQRMRSPSVEAPRRRKEAGQLQE